MRKRFALLMVVTVWALACSDRYWIHKASSAYQYRMDKFEQECVNIPGDPPPGCINREAEINQDFDAIDRATDAALRGPLSKQARADLKAVAKKP